MCESVCPGLYQAYAHGDCCKAMHACGMANHSPLLCWSILLMYCCLAAFFQGVTRSIEWVDSEQFLRLTVVSLQAILLGDNLFVVKVLYKNSGFKQIWEGLDVFKQRPKRHVIIQGPPGVGKSLACWAWSCAYSRLDNTVVYAFLKGQKFMTVIVLCGDSVISLARKTCSIEDGLEFIKIQYPEALLVVDGVRQSNMDFCLTLQGPWILVTSTGVRIKSQDEETLLQDRIHVDSWTFEEYKESLSVESLALSTAESPCPGPVIIEESVLKHDAGLLGLKYDSNNFMDMWLEEKYYFCGGSVRYMYTFDLTRSKKSIEEAFTNELNVEELLGNEDCQASTSVGNIRQRLNQIYTLLSQYVMRLLFEHKKATHSVIHMIKSRACEIGNNALQGWAHEMQMLAYLQECMNKGPETKTFKIKLQDKDGITKEELSLQLEKEHYFFKESDIVQTLNSDKVLLLPKKFNQGCYDAVVALLKNHIEGKDILMVMQATVGKGHSFKQEFLTTLILQLANNTAEVNSQQQAKKLKTEARSKGQSQQEVNKAVSVLVSRLSIWHCFVLETEDQLNEFTIPSGDSVGVRSSIAERHWEIKPTLFKALLTAPK